MIIPQVCFTCGRPISHIYDDFKEQSTKKIILPAHVHKIDDPRGQTTPEFSALAKLHIGRECCRRMFITQHDMFELIQ